MLCKIMAANFGSKFKKQFVIFIIFIVVDLIFFYFGLRI